MCQEVITKFCKITGMDPDDPMSWMEHIPDNGFIDIWHTATYYAMREDPRFYSIFAQLTRQPRLLVSLDRVCWKTPRYVSVIKDGEPTEIELPSRGLKVHTDMNLWYDLEQPSFQAGIALEDCLENAGGFACLPGFHKLATIDKFRNDFESGKYNKGHPQIPPNQTRQFNFFPDEDAELVEVPLRQGDVVVWSSRLPHCNRLNEGRGWRKHCYIRYIPADLNPSYAKVIKTASLTGQKPSHFSTGNKTGPQSKTECHNHKAPQLTPLGKRLLGHTAWEIL